MQLFFIIYMVMFIFNTRQNLANTSKKHVFESLLIQCDNLLQNVPGLFDISPKDIVNIIVLDILHLTFEHFILY